MKLIITSVAVKADIHNQEISIKTRDDFDEFGFVKQKLQGVKTLTIEINLETVCSGNPGIFGKMTEKDIESAIAAHFIGITLEIPEQTATLN